MTLQTPLQVTSILYIYLGYLCVWTCHCLDTSTCNSDVGGCQNGCNPGWYGPDCRIGNIAFRKPAQQSYTYNYSFAAYAVDGVIPNGDDSSNNCSDAGHNFWRSVWWYVNISETEDFVIRNITLLQRKGRNHGDLRRFLILYTSNVTSLPDPNTWNVCADIVDYQMNESATYRCQEGVVVGRRVAIFVMTVGLGNWLSVFDFQRLTLCEVYVDGYSYIGAGDFSDITLNTRSTCDSVFVQLINWNERRFSDILCVVYFAKSSGWGNMSEEKMLTSKADMNEVRIKVNANTSYLVWARLLMCWPLQHNCCELSREDIKNSCYVTMTSPTLPTTTKKLHYELEREGNTLRFSYISAKCELQQSITVHCIDIASNDSTKVLTQYDATFCCLNESSNYTCFVDILLPNGKVERSTHFLRSEPVDDSRMNSKLCECTTTVIWIVSVGASLMVVAIAAAFFIGRKYTSSLRQKRARPRTLPETAVANIELRNCESNYASLDPESRLQDENTYSSLKDIA